MIYTINLVIIFQIRISLFNIILVICLCVMFKTAVLRIDRRREADEAS